MGAFISWVDTNGTPKVLWFDVVTEEGHHLKSEITEFPVEEGADITDHIRPDNDRITLSTFVSNTPIITKAEVRSQLKNPPTTIIGVQTGIVGGKTLDVPSPPLPDLPTPGALLQAIGSAISNLITGKKEYKAQVLTFPRDFDNVSEVYDCLLGLRRDSQLVDVVTSVRTIKSMALENIEMFKSNETGTGAKFSIDLKAVRLVSVLSVKAPRPASSIGFNKTNAGAKGATPAAPRESLLVKGINGIGKYLDPTGGAIIK